MALSPKDILSALQWEFLSFFFQGTSPFFLTGGDFFKYFMDLRGGKVSGRTSPDQVSFFINAGTQGLQFAACARVYRLAREKGLGREIPTEWLLQDIRD